MPRQALEGASLWTGTELAEASDWRYRLTPAMTAEIHEALQQVKRRGLGWEEIGPGDFRAPSVQALFDRVAEGLERGRGLALVSGLPVERYDDADLRRLWYGLGQMLGTPVSQSNAGLRMKVIQDEGAAAPAIHGKLETASGTFLGSYSRAVSTGPLRFHTDRTDVVGLLCAGQASQGGLSKVVSTLAVHNEILRRRPDLLELLYQPYPRSRLGEEKGGEALFYLLPVFGLRDGRFTSHYSRTFIEAAQMLPGAPRLGAAQLEALDLLHAVAEALCYRMTLAPGDLQFVNNHVVYHAREAFENDPAQAKVRRLYRVWLAMPNSRALPEDHAVLWGNVAAGALRGGIAVAP